MMRPTIQNRGNQEEAEQVTVNLPMNLERARQVKWQGARMQGSMGELSDNGILSLKDLVWEIENAYNPEARSAALTILAHRLGEATTLQRVKRYGPEVVKGAKYLEEREWESLWQALEYAFVATIAITGITGLLVGQFLNAVSEGNGNTWDSAGVNWIVSVFILGIIALPLVIWQSRRINAQLADVRNFRAGREGEDWVEDMLRAHLDSKWAVFRNVVLPGEKQDLDFVLVGPSGVWVLEIKAYRNEVRVIGESWERKEGSRWNASGKSPGSQAKGNAAALYTFLVEKKVSLSWVNAVVVLTQQQPETNFVNLPEGPNAVAIWRQEETAIKLDELDSREAILTEVDHQRIVTLLKEAIEQDLARKKQNALAHSK